MAQHVRILTAQLLSSKFKSLVNQILGIIIRMPLTLALCEMETEGWLPDYFMLQQENVFQGSKIKWTI